MNKKLLALLAISTIAALLATFAVPVVSARENDVIREKAFTTYLFEPVGKPYTDTYNMFDYSGIRWRAGITVTYYVNPASAPNGAASAVKEAFETWDFEIKAELFNNNVGTV